MSNTVKKFQQDIFVLLDKFISESTVEQLEQDNALQAFGLFILEQHGVGTSVLINPEEPA